MSYPIATLESLSLLDCLAWGAALLALVQAVLLVIQTVEHRRFCKRRLQSQPRLHPTGPAVVVVPCKGLDLGLAENLQPLFEQDYANYRLVFVVESLDDSACLPIRSLLAEYPRVDASLLAAGRTTSCGQKGAQPASGYRATGRRRAIPGICGFRCARRRPPGCGR